MEKLKLRPWVKYTLIVIVIILVILGLNKLLVNDMESHIEKVSQECAEQGFGIKAYYTNQGDKFYECNVTGGYDE